MAPTSSCWQDRRTASTAAVEILTSPGTEVNGKCLIDSEVLTAAGVDDLSRYGGGANPIIDIFVDAPAHRSGAVGSMEQSVLARARPTR